MITRVLAIVMDSVGCGELPDASKYSDEGSDTLGHIAYVGHGAIFCGDTLFSAGCGRLFEGTPAQMLDSLDRTGQL